MRMRACQEYLPLVAYGQPGRIRKSTWRLPSRLGPRGCPGRIGETSFLLSPWAGGVQPPPRTPGERGATRGAVRSLAGAATRWRLRPGHRPQRRQRGADGAGGAGPGGECREAPAGALRGAERPPGRVAAGSPPRPSGAVRGWPAGRPAQPRRPGQIQGETTRQLAVVGGVGNPPALQGESSFLLSP